MKSNYRKVIVGLLLVLSPMFVLAQSSPAPSQYRVLILGDSITLHAPKESIQWKNHHGMAASAPENDYVHLVLAEVRKAMPGAEVMPMIPDGAGWAKGALSKLKEYQAFRPDFVVVQLGEHEYSNGRLPRLESDYSALLKGLLSLETKPIVVCTGVWNPDLKTNAAYSGDTEKIETTMKSVATSEGAEFVSVQDLARDPSCFGYGGDRGVRWHPNDKGMQGYATRIFTGWTNVRKARGL